MPYKQYNTISTSAFDLCDGMSDYGYAVSSPGNLWTYQSGVPNCIFKPGSIPTTPVVNNCRRWNESQSRFDNLWLFSGAVARPEDAPWYFNAGATSTQCSETPIQTVGVNQVAHTLAEGCIDKYDGKCVDSTGAFVTCPGTPSTGTLRVKSGTIGCSNPSGIAGPCTASLERWNGSSWVVIYTGSIGCPRDFRYLGATESRTYSNEAGSIFKTGSSEMIWIITAYNPSTGAITTENRYGCFLPADVACDNGTTATGSGTCTKNTGGPACKSPAAYNPTGSGSGGPACVTSGSYIQNSIPVQAARTRFDEVFTGAGLLRRGSGELEKFLLTRVAGTGSATYKIQYQLSKNNGRSYTAAADLLTLETLTPDDTYAYHAWWVTRAKESNLVIFAYWKANVWYYRVLTEDPTTPYTWTVGSEQTLVQGSEPWGQLFYAEGKWRMVYIKTPLSPAPVNGFLSGAPPQSDLALVTADKINPDGTATWSNPEILIANIHTSEMLGGVCYWDEEKGLILYAHKTPNTLGAFTGTVGTEPRKSKVTVISKSSGVWTNTAPTNMFSTSSDITVLNYALQMADGTYNVAGKTNKQTGANGSNGVWS